MINSDSLAESDLHKIIYEKTRINPHEESQRYISHRSYSKPTSNDSKQRILDKQNLKLCPKSCIDILEIHFLKFEITKNSQFLSQKFFKNLNPFQRKNYLFCKSFKYSFGSIFSNRRNRNYFAISVP